MNTARGQENQLDQIISGHYLARAKLNPVTKVAVSKQENEEKIKRMTNRFKRIWSLILTK